MSRKSKKKPTKEQLVEYAETVRNELTAMKQNEVYKIAVEIGYLAANADGTIEDSEKEALVAAVEVLSQGAVIEWEADALFEEAQSSGDDGLVRAEALGARLKELDQANAGVLVGAFVAQSASGIDRAEAKVLRAVGKGAGINERKVRELLKQVGAEAAADEG